MQPRWTARRIRELTHGRLDRPGLNVFVGDVDDASAVARAIAGCDAVISVLGPTQNRPDYGVSRGTSHIVDAMRSHGVDRLVLTAGAGVGGEGDRPGVFDRVIKALLLVMARHVYEDMRRTVELVRGTDLAWTVVRVPMLTDGDRKGQVRVGRVGVGTGPRLTRQDLVAFLLDEVQRPKHVREAPVISN